MNKMIAIISMAMAISIAILASACDGTPDITTWPLLQPEASYELDAWGTNPDVLEFTPKGNTDYFCVVTMGKRTMFCMPKKKGEINDK